MTGPSSPASGRAENEPRRPQVWTHATGELAACGVLLILFVALRLLLIVRCQVELYQPEQYIQLNLFRQIEAGLPTGGLGAYVRGNNSFDGGGTVVQSLLLLPLAWAFGPTWITVKLMALCWATTGAVLSAALGRRLFGAGGGAATLAALLALPPASVIYSCISWATHAEGAVLAIALMLAFHVTCTTARPRGPALILGLLLGSAPFFSPLNFLPATLVVVALPWVQRGRLARFFPALPAGLALGAAPFFFVDLGVGVGAALQPAALLAGLRSSDAMEAAVAALRAIPTYDVSWSGLWRPPFEWVERAELLGLAVGWGSLALLAISIAARGSSQNQSRGTRAASAVIIVTAVVLPMTIGALEHVIKDGGMQRRMVMVPMLWAFGGGFLLLRVMRSPRLPRLMAHVAVVSVVALAASPSVQLALSGAPLDGSVKLERLALDPSVPPVDARIVQVYWIARGHLPVLRRLATDARADEPASLAAAVAGVGAAVERAPSALDRRGARCPSGEYTTELAHAAGCAHRGGLGVLRGGRRPGVSGARRGGPALRAGQRAARPGGLPSGRADLGGGPLIGAGSARRRLC